MALTHLMAALQGMMKGKGKVAGGASKVLSKFAQKGKGKVGGGQKLQAQARVLSKFAQKGRGKVGGGQKLQAQAKSGKDQKYLEKLKTIDSSLKVWVGGLKENVSWKDLEKHFQSVAKPSLTHVHEKKGTGVVCFKSEEDVSTAIATFNGTELKGGLIETDVWVKPDYEKKDKSEKAKKPKVMAKKPNMMEKKPKNVEKKKQGKATAKPVVNKADEKIREQLKEVDDSQKVWVGGLVKGTNWQMVQKHFKQACKPKLVHILSEKKGTAVVTFDDASDVQTAIDMLNGSELKGKAIEVDTWSKLEKKPKKVE